MIVPTLDRVKSKRRYWTTVELRKFRELYPNSLNHDLARLFGRTHAAVKMMAVKLGLWKTPAFMASAPVRWHKGNRPWNDGKKGWQAGGRASGTRFKAGHRGARQRPVGTERRERDGWFVKIAEPDVWQAKPRYVWEQHFGKITAGAIVRLKDGNVDNCAPANLAMMRRGEHLRANVYPWRRHEKRPAWTAPLRLAA